MNPTSVRRKRARPPSDRAKTASPPNRTRPAGGRGPAPAGGGTSAASNRPWRAGGRSRAPRRWRSVDFPTPDAPTRTTTSPRATERDTPLSTRTTSGPPRYSFSRSRTATSSLIAEHLHRVEPGGPPRGQQRERERDQERRPDDQPEVAPGELHGKVIDLIDVARQPDDPVGVLDPDEAQPYRAPRRRPHEPDQHPDGEEHRPHASGRRPHRLQDPDLFPLLRHQQDEVPDDREGRHQHDDRHDDEEGQLLQLQRVEEVPVHFHPIPEEGGENKP